MLNTDNDLDVKTRNLTSSSRSPKYHQPIADLHLSKSRLVSILTEATDRAIQLTEAPVALFSVPIESRTRIGAIAGLENFPSITTNSDLTAELSGLEFCDRATIDRDGSFSIDDCGKDPDLRQSSLYQLHGIRSYLGVTVLTAAGDTIGTIAILDFIPRKFSTREINSLQVISRWIGSEFDRTLLVQSQLKQWLDNSECPAIYGVDDEIAAWEHRRNKKFPHYPSIEDIKLELLTHLAQELRTPLTSVLGMSRVLHQEIYGPLSVKQKSYLDIILTSGLQLVTIVDEIANLGELDRQKNQLSLKPVDIEMLCQSAIQSVEPLAKHKQQKIDLTISSDRRIWLLDKEKVKNILYYLMSSLIQTMESERILTVRVCSSEDRLEIDLQSNDLQAMIPTLPGFRHQNWTMMVPESMNSLAAINIPDVRIHCGLSLSQALAKIHSGKIEVNRDRSGYHLHLPLMIAGTSHN